MSNRKISELTELAAGSVSPSDLVVIVDSSSTETKKVSVGSFTSSSTFDSRGDLVTYWDSLSTSEKSAIPTGTIWSWPNYSIFLMPAGHAAYGTDPIADLAGWAPHASVTPFHWGAAGDGTTDDWDAFDSAMSYVASLGGGEVFVPKPPGDYYRTIQALRFDSPGVVIRCESPTTRIHCTGNGGVGGNWPNYGSVLLGTYTTLNANRVPRYDLDATAIKDDTVTTSTASDAANFAVGDVIFVADTNKWLVGTDPISSATAANPVVVTETGHGRVDGENILIKSVSGQTELNDRTFNITVIDSDTYSLDGEDGSARSAGTGGFAGNWRPKVGQMNVVTSVDSGTGVIGLRHNMQHAITSPEIQNLSNPNVNFFLSDGTDTGLENFATRDCKILGGWWSTDKEAAPFCASGGAIDCVIAPDRVTSRNGVAYGNLYANCTLSCPFQEVRRQALELAYLSHNNMVDLRTSVYTESASSFTFGGGVSINEGASKNTVKIDTLDCGTAAHDNGLYLVNCNGNHVSIGNLIAPDVSGALVRWTDTAYTGSRPDCSNNTVTIQNAIGGSSDYYVRHSGLGQQKNNRTKIGAALGAVSSDAIYLDGDDNSGNSIEGWFENGGITVVGETGYKVSGYVPDGISKSGDYDTEILAGRLDIETENSRLLDAVRIIRTSHNATSASPSVTTRTVPAGALNPGDEIHFYASVFLSGTLSGSNKTFTVEFAGSIGDNFITTAAGSEVIISGRVTYATNTVAVVQTVIYEGDSVGSTGLVAIGSLDLTANPYDLVLSVTPANAADSLPVRAVKVWSKSAGAGEF